jgi:hypothetical protein
MRDTAPRIVGAIFAVLAAVINLIVQIKAKR